MPIPDTSYNPVNYAAQGGASWVIGATGTLDIATGGKITAAGTQAAAITAITDSTGGVASTTFAAITAGGSYAQADMTATKNALAQIAVTLNAIRAALQGVGITA